MILSRQSIKRAKELRAKNPHKWSWAALARLFDCTQECLRRRVEPGYSDKWDKGRRRNHEGMTHVRRPITEEELKERKSLIPTAHPDNTGRLMGDPIPNDRRRAA